MSIVQTFATSRIPKSPPSGDPVYDREKKNPRQQFLIGHQDTFAAKYNYTSHAYYDYFDEALRDSWTNALAMRRDGLIQELINHRALAGCGLPSIIESDDPEDREQKEICHQVLLILKSVYKFQYLKRSLDEAIFFGKFGAQVVYGTKLIDGAPRVTIINHQPVMGDKIVFDWEGVPAILVHTGDGFYANINKRDKQYIRMTDRGMAFFLADPFYRDRFVIHEFEPTDTDFLFEGDMALAVHGLGLRSRFYWTWNLRVELLGWMMDALQRIGANGMLIGYFQSGNPNAEAAILKVLENLMKYNYAAVEVQGATPPKDMITRIEPTSVGYDVMFNLVQHLEGIMRRGFLGQEMTSQFGATGMGSGMADLAGDSFENIVTYDAKNLSDTINQDVLPPLLRYNIFKYKGKKYRGDELPFQTWHKFNLNRRRIAEKINAATQLLAIGVPLDLDGLREEAGFDAPKPGAAPLVPLMMQPQAQAGGGRPGVIGGPGEQPKLTPKPQNRTTPAARPNLPPG